MEIEVKHAEVVKPIKEVTLRLTLEEAQELFFVSQVTLETPIAPAKARLILSHPQSPYGKYAKAGGNGWYGKALLDKFYGELRRIGVTLPSDF